jgi:hypothetical protein
MLLPKSITVTGTNFSLLLQPGLGIFTGAEELVQGI